MLKLLIYLSTFCSTLATTELPHQVPEPRFATPCQTPNFDVGVCVEIKTCSVFIDSLITGNQDNHEFIRASRCSPLDEHNFQPKVCCGRHADYLNKTIEVPPTTTKAPKKGGKNPLPKVCGNQTVATIAVRIVGGKKASIGEFPWMARLRHRRKDGLFNYGCAGFLISNKFVLTAAHCIRSKHLAPLGPLYQVQLGEHDTEADPDCVRFGIDPVCAASPVLVRTGKPIVHPEYSDNIQQHNDIAVIPLKRTVKFTEWVYPICLAKEPATEKEMWLSGWGKTDTLQSSPIKLKVSVWRETLASCAATYRAVHIRVLHSQLCAGSEEGHDSCTGDSGGPLMVRNGSEPWQAEGIVSFGMGCGLEGWPGIYTNIPEYIPWIKKAMNRFLRKHENDGVKH